MKRSSKFGFGFCLAASAVGAFAVSSHLVGSSAATAVLEGRPIMVLTTALMIMVSGAAGAARARIDAPRWVVGSSTLGGALVSVVGFLTLAEYVFDVSLGIDIALPWAAPTGPHPGRPSPLTGAMFATVGLSLALFDVPARRRVEPREGFAIVTALIAFVSLVGHAVGANAMYRIGDTSMIGVSLPTGVSLLFIAVGILLLRPDAGLAQLVTSSGPAGAILRKLGTAALVGGAFLAALAGATTQPSAFIDLPLALAIGIVLAVALALAVLVITAIPLAKAHENLEVARERLFQLLEQAPEGIFVANLDGRYTEVNETACRLLGYERNELIGMTILDLIRPEEADRLWSDREQLLAGATVVGEWMLRRKDGTRVPAEVSTRILADGRWQAFVRDITERVRLRGELVGHLEEQEFLARVGVELANCLEVKDVLSAVAELVTDFLGEVCVIDLVEDGALVRATDRRAAGAEETNAPTPIPRHLLLRVLETQTCLVSSDATLLRAPESQDSGPGESAHRAPTSVMLVPMFARGHMLAILGVASARPDRLYGPRELRVTEELARRAALALDNARLYQASRLQGAVTTHLAEGVVLIRQQDARIVYVNPRFAAMFGYEPDELLGLPISTVNAPGDRSPEETARTIIAELQRSGAWHGEIANITKSGDIVWSHASVSSFDHEKHGQVWIAVHTDMTEQKNLSLANERALREKEVLLREIHHRVRNNLQVISSLFSLQRATTTNEELRSMLDDSKNRVQSIATVHELLYRSSSLAEVAFDDYLHELVESIRGSYGGARVRVEVQAAGIRLDADRAVPCALLVGELVSNSFKHAFPDGVGTIAVRARREEPNGIVFEVEDDGRGIPSGVDWSTSKSLGLRLVGMFVRQLGGTIELDRSHGTRFVVRFPLERRQGTRPPPPKVELRRG